MVAIVSPTRRNPDLPRTHCTRGHDLSIVGRYKGGQCKKCKRIAARIVSARRARQQRLELERAKLRPGNASRVTGDERTPDAEVILSLVEERDRAQTWWDREAIQQRIDEEKRR